MVIDTQKGFAEWKPPVVCLCGSTQFIKAFSAENLRLTLAGFIVLTVGCDTQSDDQLKLEKHTKDKLDLLHIKKIAMADEVRILNVDGYVGESTAREFAFARWVGKKVTWLKLTPTIKDRHYQTTMKKWLKDETPLIEHIPYLTEGSVRKLMDACEDIKKNEVIAPYHFQGEVKN